MVKKGIILIVLIISFIFIFTILGNLDSKTESPSTTDVRLRILANSNSEADQMEKEIVKKELMLILKDHLFTETEVIEQKLKNNLEGQITKQIKVSFDKTYFPAKTYEGKFIPSGNYPTLLIEIGDAKGKNFWTLLYPEYYNISFSSYQEIEYRSYFIDKLKEILNN